ncbi:MAG: AAA family ATPase [Devosia sp.]
MPQLTELGRRIMICGPSNSGKSTLARALSRRLGVPAVYLDQLHHTPGTAYRPRPRDEFVRLHNAAIAEDAWVIEGNYGSTMPARLARATGIIHLGSEPLRGLFRYVRRTLFEPDAAGRLENGIDRVNREMVRYILFVQPRTHAATRKMLADSGLPLVALGSMGDLNALYREWQLAR